MKDVLKINDLERLRLLSDPLKLTLLKAFGERDGTVAEVAEAIREPVTKLYRHVDALLDNGLIEVTDEQRKRGAVERRFRTVARRFEVEESLFSASDAGPEDDSVRALLRDAEREILSTLHRKDPEFPPTFARLRASVSPDQFKELQARLGQWLEDLEAGAPDDDEVIELGAMIAFYRMPD